MLKIRDLIVIFALCMTLLLFFIAFTPYTYSTNINAREDDVTARSLTKESLALAVTGSENRTIAVLKNRENDRTSENIKDVVINTLDLMQIKYELYDSFHDIGDEKMIMITDSFLADADIATMKAFLADGGMLIFTTIPDDLNDELAELFGIKTHEPDFSAAGFTIYDGIILKGLMHVPEHEFICEGLTLHGNAKIFASGYSTALADEIKEDPVRAEYPDITPLIWRTIYEGGQVFVINAPFMEDAVGSGILAGILSLCYEDLIYPVIGTKTVALQNFPYTHDLYYPVNARTTFAYIRDIIWPSLLSTAKNMELTYTCYTNGDFSSSNEAENTIQFILEELYHLSYGELAYEARDQALIKRDMQYLSEIFPGITINSLINSVDVYGDNITSLSNTDEFAGFHWINDTAVTLPITGTGNNVLESTFAFESYITAFGFAMHHIDMEPVFLEEGVANIYMRDISEKLYDLFGHRNYLTESSARTAAEKVKNYLNLNTAVSYQKDEISVILNGHNEAVKFVLRTNKDIDERLSHGISINKIYEEVYLLTVSGEEFSVVFKE